MKDYVQHIKKLHEPLIATSYCGKAIAGFYFMGVDHMIASHISESRLIACKKCLREIEKIIIKESELE